MLTRRVSVGRAALLVCLAGSMVVSPALAQTVTLTAPMTTAIDDHSGDPTFWITSGGGEFPPPTSDQITAKIDDIMANDPNYEKDSDTLYLSTAKGVPILGTPSDAVNGDYEGADGWYITGVGNTPIPVKIAASGATPSVEQNNSAAGRAQRNKTVLQTGVQDYITNTTGGVGACSDQLTDAIDALYISSGTVGLAASILTAATSILSWLGGEIPANLMSAVGAGLGLGGAITTQVANGMPNCEAQFTGTIQGDANIYAGLGIAAFENAITLGSKDGQSYVKGVSLGGGMLQGAGTGGDAATAVDGDSVAIGNGSYAGPGNTAIGTNANAFGLESTAIGNGAQAIGDYSTAIGHGAEANGDYSTAIGHGAIADAENATAVGQGAVAEAENATAVGQGAWASAINASAFGQDAWATAINASAFGQDAWATAANASAFGQGASASGAGATALGVGSNAEGENGVAIGDADVLALATDGVAIGTGAVAGAEKATALGAGAGALGQGSIAIGDADVVALATDGIAIGTGAGVLGEQSIAMGSGAIAGSVAPGDAGGSTAVGANSTALGTDATAFGKGALADGEEVAALGQNSTAKGKSATAAGSGATADGEAVAAFGSGATAGGIGNTAIGDDAQAFGGGPLLGTSNMTALGQASRAYATNTLAVGQGAWALAEGATALGQGSRASGTGSTAVGNGAVADFAHSAAYGEGAVASAIGQQVFGTTDNTYAMRGLTSHLSTVRQSGPKSLVTSDKNGNLAADEGMYEQIGQNQQGVAMAMALGNFWVPESKKFALGVNTATFDGVWALGVNVGGQIKDGLNLNGGIAASSSGMVTGRAGALMSW